MQFMELGRRTMASFGMLLTILSGWVETGSKVLRNTYEVLQQEKYNHVWAHFQKSILLVYALLTELKLGVLALKGAMKENPEDFAEGTKFLKDLEVDFQKVMKECFAGTEAFVKEMADEAKDNIPKLPEFIRNSAEYRAYKTGSREVVNEERYVAELLKAFEGAPSTVRKNAKEAHDEIEQKGFATFLIMGEDYKITGRIILWADKFEMELPADMAKELECEPKWPYAELDAPAAEQDIFSGKDLDRIFSEAKLPPKNTGTPMSGNHFVDDDNQRS